MGPPVNSSALRRLTQASAAENAARNARFFNEAFLKTVLNVKSPQ
jgi:hypothetical protein